MSIGAEIGAAAASSAMGSVLPIVGMVRDQKWRDEDIARSERLTKQQWQRDDSAIQRRVADMKAAGINPLLAAGSAANSSAPTFTSRAPQSVAGGNVDAVMARENIATSRKQRELIQAQIDGQYGSLAVARQDSDTRARSQATAENQLSLNRAIEERNTLIYEMNNAKTDVEKENLRSQIIKNQEEINVLKNRDIREAAAENRNVGMYEHNMIYADRAAAPYGQQPTIEGAALSSGIQKLRSQIGSNIKAQRALDKAFSDNDMAALDRITREHFDSVKRASTFSTHDFKVSRSKSGRSRPNYGRQSHGYYY